jgi:predicted RNA-binding protein YlxR (DUF448 family)
MPSAAPEAGATRTCVVCRQERAPSSLLRIGALDGVAVVGRPDRGRSAWVCVRRECFDRVSARALSRGMRQAVSVDEMRFLDDLHGFAERRVLEMVGLARRQGGLRTGVEEVTGGSGVVLVANDLSSRGRRGLGDAARIFVDGLALGRAAGMGWLGAARIDVERLAEQAAYWFGVWYESRSTGAAGAIPELAEPADYRTDG